MSIYFYETDIGKIGIAEKNGRITNLYFPNGNWPQDMEIYEAPILKEAAQQLQNYLASNLTNSFLPLEPSGGVFMKQVWTSLCERNTIR